VTTCFLIRCIFARPGQLAGMRLASYSRSMMKIFFFAFAVVAICMLTVLTVNTVGADRAASEKKLLRHVVAFKFKEEVSKEQIRQVEIAFAGLKKDIPTIVGFEFGTNNSPEKGFTHCFLLTFRSEKDRDDYLPHPAHKEFGKLVGPLLADVFVIDYWARD
jgi:hypothetical protein